MNRYAMARELGKKILNEPIFVVTDALEGREYSGLLLGVIENGKRFYAALCFDGHVTLHGATRDDVPALESLTGKNVDISSADGRIQNLIDSESISKRLDKNRGWSR
jgi:hypothetical protein